MASLNQIQLIGYLGKEPEIKAMANGDKVANFSLAVTERGYKKADGTDVPEKTEWFNIVAWRKLAEVTQNFLHKGSMVFIQGKLHTHTYDGQDGQKKYLTQVIVERLDMLDRKADQTVQNTTSCTTPALQGGQQYQQQQNNFQNPQQVAPQPQQPQQRDVFGQPTYPNQQAPQQPPQQWQPEPYQPSQRVMNDDSELPF